MIKRIIFIVESPFNERDYDRFGVEILISNGFGVEIWDFTPILCREAYKNVVPPDPINYSNLRIFTHKKDIIGHISKLKDHDLVIFFIGFGIRSYFIFRCLSKYNVKYCKFAANILPTPSISKRNIVRKILSLTTKKFINGIFARIPYRYLGFNNVAIILAGGIKSVTGYYEKRKSEYAIMWIHSFDYDLYMREKDKCPIINEKYAVFLDEYLPFHPDYFYQGIMPPTAPEEYYPMLNKFFEVVENKFSVKVIIAAHPRSHYERYSEYFDCRECIRGKTSALIKNAAFVITHASTAINYAVLYEKPIYFVTSDKIDNCFEGPYLREVAYQLGNIPINLDKNFKIDELPRVDKEIYDKYRNSYIKKDGTPETPFWQIFSDRIKNI